MREEEELPEGWRSRTLAELTPSDAPIQYGILQPGPDVPGGVPYVRPTEIRNDAIDVTALRRTSPAIAAKYHRAALKGGDVLLSIVGSIGKVAVVPASLDGANITQSSARVRPIVNQVTSDFLAYFLRSPFARTQFDGVLLGTGVPRLNIGDVRNVVMPLPPLLEQERVVAAVERAFTSLRSVSERLSIVRATLHRFRQAVLTAACDGRLTADWREATPTAAPVATLLGRLRLERRQQWPTTRRGYREASHPNEERLDGLPDTWSLTTVSHLAWLDVGFAFPSASFRKEGVRLLRGENVAPGGLRWEDERCWDPRNVSPFEHLLVKEGEIILALDRPIISTGLKLARATANDTPCLLVQRVMRFRMVDSRFTGFLFLCLRHQRFIDELTGGMTGSDLPHVTGTVVADFTVPFPPPEEQQEIVRRVEALFALADTIEKRVAAASARADKLTQAILAKAFRGELVPTEAELNRRREVAAATPPPADRPAAARPAPRRSR